MQTQIMEPNLTETERFLEIPSLPMEKVSSVIISGEYPAICKSLEQRSIWVMRTKPSQRLPVPTQFHADMLCCYLGKGILAVAKGENQMQDAAISFGLQTILTDEPLSGQYPGDAGCNILQIGNRVFLNPKSADEGLQRALKHFPIYATAQGYTRCAAAIVDQDSVITADMGLSMVLKRAGLNVLEIQPGAIRLPGYPYGFIGGCCGLIAPNQLAFTGSLEFHPDSQKIKSFLQERGVQWIELTNEPLLDIGGIIPITERVQAQNK